MTYQTRSPDDYLPDGKNTYFEYKATHNSADESLSQALTLAGSLEKLRGLLVYSHREGHQTKNQGSYTYPYNQKTPGYGVFGYGIGEDFFNPTPDYSIPYASRKIHFNSVDAIPEIWRSDALLAKVLWSPDSQHQFGLTYDYLDRRSRLTDDAIQFQLTTALTILNRDQNSSTTRNRITAEHVWTPSGFGPIDKLSSQVYYQKAKALDLTEHKIFYPLPDADLRSLAVSGLNTDIRGANVVMEKRLDRQHIFLGLDASREKTARPLQSVLEVFGKYATGAPPEPDGNYPPPQAGTTVNRIGGFFSDELDFNIHEHHLRITPGLRIDRWSYASGEQETYLQNAASVTQAQQMQKLYGDLPRHITRSPQLNIAFDLKKNLAVYAQYKHGERAPGINEMIGSWSPGRGYALFGNPDLKTETSQAYELGLRGELSTGIHINTSVFYNKYKNFIDYVRVLKPNAPAIYQSFLKGPGSPSVLYIPMNRDMAMTKGASIRIDLSPGSWSPALRGFSISAAAGIEKGEIITDSPVNGRSREDLASVPPLKGVLKLAYDAPSGIAGTSLVMTSVKHKVAPKSYKYSVTGYNKSPMFRVPGYTTFDLMAYYNIDQHLYLQLQVSNIFSKKYWNYNSARDLQMTTLDYRDIELRTEPGRSLMVTLGGRF